MKDRFAVSMFGQKRLSREGGIEIVVKELCTRMARDGCQVTCYNRSGHHVSGAEYDNKIEYDGIRQKFVPTIERKGLAAVSSSFFAALYSAFGKYDVVHIHAEGPAFFSWLPKMFGKRVVVTIHNRGYSSIFVHTEKGRQILEVIKSHIEIQKEDINRLVTENGVMVCNSAKPHPRRVEFYQLAEHYPIDKALNKIDPITLKDKIIEKSKRFLFKTGLITVARHLKKGKKVEVVENK